MHQHRITMLSSSETCHLGSSSNNQAMDQQNLLPSNPTTDEQNLLPNTLEDEDYPHYLLSSHEVEMPNGSVIGQQNTSLNLWDSAGSSSMGCVADHDSLIQAKREHFAPALSIRAPLIIGGRRREGGSSLPSQSLNIDLNLSQADQFDSQDVDMVQSDGQPGINAFPLNSGLSIREHVMCHTNSSSATGNPSQIASISDGMTGQEFSMLGGHRSSCKRKNIDGSLAESSANGSSCNNQRNNYILEPSPSSHESTSGLTMPTPTNHVFSYSSVEQLSQNTNMSANAMLSDRYSLYGDPHERERFLRNTRMRISPNEYDQLSSNLLPEGSLSCSVSQPTQQQSLFIPVQPRASSSSTSSLSRPYVPAVTQFSQNLHRAPSSGNFGSRIGIFPSSADTTDQLSTQDPIRSSVRSNFPEPLLLGSSLFPSDSTELLSMPGGRSNQQNSSSTIRQIRGLNAPQPISSSRGSVDIIRRSLQAASVPQSRSSSITSQQHRGHSSTSHEIRSHQPGSSSRANQQHYVRAVPHSVGRQNSNYLDLQSFMQSIAASRDGIRTVSESANQLVHLRNVVEQIRQGRGGRFEDPNFERVLFARRASLIDRHRDMRLDVDNMSYEELLALGERIGYVSTGLSEEKIRTGLKQWKYVSILFEESLAGVEPCCICQEEYAEGEDMGRLDCGHDFHTACIKQWLVIKNLCPICKKTGLGT